MSASPTARLKQLVPYAIAIAALAWILHKTDLNAFAAALKQAPIALFVLFSLFMLLLNCAADTYAMATVFSWFGCRVPYRELFVVRASTYLVAIINYHVGQAAIISYLFKVRKMAFLRSSGVILFIIGVNVGTIFLLASAGALRVPPHLRVLKLIPPVCVVGCVLYAAVLTWRPQFLAERKLLGPLFEMGIAGHAKGVLVRLPHVACLLVWHFFSLRMFHIRVSPLDALLYLPMYFAVAAMPINVNGLGVAQQVAITFFAPFAEPPGAADPATQRAMVLAYSLATVGISLLLQFVLGFACIRRATALGASVSSAKREKTTA